MKNIAVSDPLHEGEYKELLQLAVTAIETGRTRTARLLNTATISSYWEIGKLLEERKIDSKHGDNIVRRLSNDLKSRYPDIGLSPRNLWNMKRFYLHYHQVDTKVQRAVALLPWGHNLLLINYDLSPEHVLFYTNEVITKGWSREMLSHALKSGYHLSIQSTAKTNNFADTLSATQAEYANEVFRCSYNLGFIDTVEPLKELELERRLLDRISTFIMELGSGFSFTFLPSPSPITGRS